MPHNTHKRGSKPFVLQNAGKEIRCSVRVEKKGKLVERNVKTRCHNVAPKCIVHFDMKLALPPTACIIHMTLVRRWRFHRTIPRAENRPHCSATQPDVLSSTIRGHSELERLVWRFCASLESDWRRQDQTRSILRFPFIVHRKTRTSESTR